MASDAVKNKALEQKRFYHARMKFSQLLMVAHGALKLDHTTVIFVDSGVKIDET